MRTFRFLLRGVALCGAAALAMAGAAAWAENSSYDDQLLEKGIDVSADGLNGYLQQLHPTAEQRRQALELIDRLGDDSFSVRERAMEKLLILPVL
ncbi:MAG: hypothetical protein KDA41_11280, partial [Planctomycetales bacterium]|nr:hypothetical protein [Planctomycetales bacterium]